MPVAPEKLDEARALRAAGAGWTTMAREVGVPETTLKRHLDPAYAARLRVLSRQAKQRRKGRCDDCGAPTVLNRENQPARWCAACAPLHARVVDHDEVIRLRLQEGLTQTEIARRVGCNQSTVSDILRAAGHGVGKGSGPNRGPRLLA